MKSYSARRIKLKSRRPVSSEGYAWLSMPPHYLTEFCTPCWRLTEVSTFATAPDYSVSHAVCLVACLPSGNGQVPLRLPLAAPLGLSALTDPET